MRSSSSHDEFTYRVREGTVYSGNKKRDLEQEREHHESFDDSEVELGHE